MPQPVGLGLVVGDHLMRGGIAVRRPCPNIDAHRGESQRQRITLLACRLVAYGPKQLIRGAIGKYVDINEGGVICLTVTPQANRVAAAHADSAAGT